MAKGPDIEDRYQRAKVLFNNGKYVEAEKFFRECLSIDPDNVTALHAMGLSQQRRGDLHESLSTLLRAVQLNPECAEHRNSLGEGYRLLQKYPMALREYRECLQRDPRNHMALNNSAIVLLHQDEFAEALNNSHRAIALKPDFTNGHLTQGNVFKKMGSTEEALNAYKRVISLDPTFAMAWTNLGTCLQEMDKLQEALDAHQQAIKADPRCIIAYLNKGNLLRQAGNLQEAGNVYVEAVGINPTNVAAQSNACAIVAELKLTKDAIAHYERLRDTIFAQEMEPHVLIGSSLLKGGDPTYALKCAHTALSLGTSGPAYALEGDAYEALKRPKEALASFEKGLELSPKRVELHSSKAGLLKNLGRLDESLVSYKAAFACQQNDPTQLFNTAQACEYVGDLDKGISVVLDYLRNLDADVGDASLAGGSASTPNIGSDGMFEKLTTINHYALYLILIKHLYLNDDLARIPALLKIVSNFSPLIKKHLQSLNTHWAYYFFISNLYDGPCPPISNRSKPLFVIGDSHCVSDAWREVTFRGERRTLVPKLVTGLKVWHMQPGYKFLTSANLQVILDNLPTSVREAVFVAGEIDCREGIGPAVTKGKYKSIDEAIAATAKVYNKALLRLEEDTGIRFYVKPITPPVTNKLPQRTEIVKTFNATLSTLMNSARFLDYFSSVTDSQGVMLRMYNCDGTHMNPSYTALLEASLSTASAVKRRVGED